MNILICGYGNIGRHIDNEFKSKNNTLSIYDKYKINDKKVFNCKYDVAFICVPTEMNPNGSANIDEVIDSINKVKDICKVIIIKSAIPVGTAESLGIENIVVSPEVYGTTQHSEESPNYAILGGNRYHTHLAAQVYQTVKNGSFHFIFTDWRTAELSKYMENCWLAMKVTFCNEFASIAKYYDIDYSQLRECFIADSRVNPSHTFVYDDKPYYNSHCLNKDIPALLSFCKENNIDAPVMQSIYNINQKKKKENNYES